MRLRWSIVACLLAWLLIGNRSLTRAEDRQTRAPMQVGMNLNMVNDYDPAWVFVDAFQQSRPWIAHAHDTQTSHESWGEGGEVELTPTGWPKRLRTWNNPAGHPMQQRLATLIYREIGQHYPAGVYRAEWRGTGELLWGFAARELRRGQTDDGRHVADLQVEPDEAGIYLKILAMDPDDPIRDIHLWVPDMEREGIPRKVWRVTDRHSPFHPAFVDRLRPFHAVRFMDWGRTNTSHLRTWNERPTLADARQTDPEIGVALEYMIGLANELHQDPWFNLPLAADDDYVRQFATMVRQHLHPDLRIYVEWSNENWNYAYGFQGARWLDEQVALPANQGLGKWQIAAREMRRDFAICREVFQGAEQRLIRVVAGQAANVGVATELCQAMEGEFDAVAMAAYFYLPDEGLKGFTRATTTDQLLEAASTTIPRTLNWVDDHARLAKQYTAMLGRPILLVAYEGGQHFETGGQDVPYLAAMFAAQSDPRMEKLYDQLLQGCSDKGVSLFMHYAYAAKNTKHGSWGAFEYQDTPDDQAPKYRSLVRATGQARKETP